MALGIFELAVISVLLLIPLVWKSSHALRYYVKITFYNFWVIFCTSLVLPIAFLRPGNVYNISYIQKIMNSMSSMFGVVTEVRGKENLESDKPRVFVCNHQSSIDLISSMRFMPVNTTAMMKKQLMYAGPFGLCCWLCGIIFVDRAGKGQGHKVTEGAAKVMNEKNVNVWIFPEGTRNFNGEILPFKKGAFHLAVQAQVPICPIVFSSYRNFLDKKNRVFNAGKVIAVCLPQISTEGLTIDDVNDLTERVRNMMIDTYNQISAEVMSTSTNVKSNVTSHKSAVTSAEEKMKEEVSGDAVKRNGLTSSS